MMKTFKWLFMAVALWIHANASAEAAIIFVGSWDLATLPPAYQYVLNANEPPVFTAQEAAALLYSSTYGGTASDYSISTVDSSIANINNKAWVDAFGAMGGISLQGENFSADVGSIGYQTSGDISALVSDNGPGIGSGTHVNYAFFNSATVPEPASAVLLGIGSLAMVVRRLRRRTSVVA